MVSPEEQGTGYEEDLRKEQQRVLQEVRARLGQEIQHPRFTDPLLLRFLRSKNFDAEKAVEALRKHLKFRKDKNLDAIPSGIKFGFESIEVEFPEFSSLKKYYPHGYHSTDREGRPVYIERLGELDPKGLLSVVTPEQILWYFTYESERSIIDRLPACSVAAGHLVETSMSIIDLKGLNFNVATNSKVLKVIQAISKDQEDNFPCTVSTMIIVNAPAVFSLAWSAIKPMLDPRTVERIQIFSAGQFANARERLLELISPEELPSFLGGCCCKCEGDCILSDRGPWSDPDIQKHFLTKPYWELVGRFVEGNSFLCTDPVKPANAEACAGVDTIATPKSDTFKQYCDEEIHSAAYVNSSIWHSPRGEEAKDSEENENIWHTPCSSEAGDLPDKEIMIMDESSSMEVLEPEEEPENAYRSHILFTALVHVNDDRCRWTPRYSAYKEATLVNSIAEQLQPFIEYAPGTWWNCAGSRVKKPVCSDCEASCD